MRAIWTGEIAFGLVTIPAKLYSGTHDQTPRFHLIHKACGTRVQIVRRCPKCQKDLSWDEIDKAYEVSKGKSVRFTKDELAGAEDQGGKGVIEIVEFVSPEEVDPAYVENSYWVGPGGKSARSFALLRAVLEDGERVAIAKVTLRARGRLARLRPRDHLFSLDLLRFGDELVGAKDLDVPVIAPATNDKERKLARTLVDQLSGHFDPRKHPDAYRARVGALVDEKVERGDVDAVAQGGDERGHGKRTEGAKVVDLSELLARSLVRKASPGPAKTRAAHGKSASQHRPRRHAAS